MHIYKAFGAKQVLKWSDIDLDNKLIRITKSWNPKLRGIKSTKNSDWRNGHISSDLVSVLIELKNERGHEEFVLPHLTGWDGGYAGRILRDFLNSIGIEKYVNFIPSELVLRLTFWHQGQSLLR